MKLKENQEIESTIITNLDFILSLSIFNGILNKDISKINIENFTKKFNQFFFNTGNIWYNDADKVGIITAKEYTKEQVKELLLAIKDSTEVLDDDIEIKEINDIPYILSVELAQEVKTWNWWLRKWNISFWIFKWNEAIGYINWDFWELWLSINWLYITEKYRKKWLATNLLKSMMNKSVEKWFSRLDIWKASWKGQDALLRLAKKYDEEWENVQFEMWSEDLSNYAILELNNKGQENSYFKGSENVNDNIINIY